MTVVTKIKGIAAATGFAATLLTGGATYAFAEDVTLTMAVPDWPPTRLYLRESPSVSGGYRQQRPILPGLQPPLGRTTDRTQNWTSRSLVALYP